VAIQQQAAAGTGAAAGGDAPDVRLVGVRKAYGDVVAVDGVDLEIASGEFFTLLGPSGSGKTTTLRLIAGFERPDAGRIELGGKDVTGVPPYTRDVNTVFQDYALARALVNHPQVLLLDEPLGALDLKLRQEMQIELKRLQQAVREVGITFVYVTHDQEEALTMSDRLAVFNNGRIEQIGTPATVYERPENAFVAGFVGASNVIRRGGRTFTVRPEKIRMTENGGARRDDENAATGRIRDVVYAGMFTRYIVDLDDGGELVVVRQNLETSSTEVLDARGRRVLLQWSPEHAIETKPETGGEA